MIYFNFIIGVILSLAISFVILFSGIRLQRVFYPMVVSNRQRMIEIIQRLYAEIKDDNFYYEDFQGFMDILRKDSFEAGGSASRYLKFIVEGLKQLSILLRILRRDFQRYENEFVISEKDENALSIISCVISGEISEGVKSLYFPSDTVKGGIYVALNKEKFFRIRDEMRESGSLKKYLSRKMELLDRIKRLEGVLQ